jgi:hypothetical protein
LPEDNDSLYSDVLKWISLPVITNVDCVAAFGEFVTSSNICIDTQMKYGTCSVNLILFLISFHANVFGALS